MRCQTVEEKEERESGMIKRGDDRQQRRKMTNKFG
jgi:hypothetical protein